MRNRIGEKTGTMREKVTLERIEAFRRSVGATAGSNDVAPPTFMTVLRAGEFELLRTFGIPLSALLHGEQTYTYAEPIRAGDELEFETKLAQALSKQGSKGSMHFLTFETAVTAVRPSGKAAVGTCRSVIVVREARAR